MKKSRDLALRIFFVFIVIINLWAQNTSADLKIEKTIKDNRFEATTLSFSGNSTINTNKTNIMFKTMDLKAGGFDVASLRIKKEGKMDFSYKISSAFSGENQELCQTLVLDVIKDKKFIYQGKLSDFLMEVKNSTSGLDDYIFILYLNDNNQDLSQKSCQFDFNFKSFRIDEIDGKGFSDEEKINNFITSGIW